MTPKKVKWAAGGLLGGLLLSYAFVGAYRLQRAASPVLPTVQLGVVWQPIQPVVWQPVRPVVAVTNLQLSELSIELPPQWVGPGVPSPRFLNPYYCLDLIDTHYKWPQRLGQP